MGADLGRDTYHNDTFNRFNPTFTPTNLANISPIPPVNLGNPVYIPKPALSATLQRLRSSLTDAVANNGGVYLNDQLDLNAEWKIVLGLRWDRFEVSQNQFAFNYFPTGAGPINTTTPAVTFTALNHTDSMLSQRAGVIWQPGSQQSYYASYGTSFNPSGESVTLSTNNASLDPEKNTSYELGAKWSLLDTMLLLTGSIFRVEKTNARTTDPAGGTVQVLDGLTRVDGVEFGATGTITKNWSVLAGYSFLNGKIVDSNDLGTGANLGLRAEGHVPQNTPRHSATVWTSYHIADAWEIGGGAVYSSDRFVNNFETAVIDGYVRADVTAAFVQKRYDIRLNILNATDKVYYETASGGRATPATGRTAIARFAYRF
jgi:catecholate siderophore receptor